jgi:ABC-type Zn uptake system ZnuABC Zn-binding protein ZnuA
VEIVHCKNNGTIVMKRYPVYLIILVFFLAACQPVMNRAPGQVYVLAVESFLADITRNVTGDRLIVDSLIPVDADPHAYQPSPQDAVKITKADILIINGANLENFLAPILQNAGGHQLVIQASTGLESIPDPSGQNPEGDPHFWLDPNNVVKYVGNIRDGFSQVDPAGSTIYAANAQKYIGELQALDAWIFSQVQNVPRARRLLVTNHETFGYFARRYGFTVVGAILPSITSGAAPSAQELAALINQIRSTKAPAIFLEVGTSPQLAEQIASEADVKVVSDLYTHSLSASNGPAATYIDMMKHDVIAIVEALK